MESDAMIREARSEDADAIAALLLELGYPATPELLRRKLEVFAQGLNDKVMVVEEDGALLGVISLHVVELFHAEGRLGRITSLIVSEAARGRGVGTGLVEAADRYFRDRACVRAEVTSGDHRAEAHAFYQRRGYLPDERRFVKHYETPMP
ncbi:GNAT family N-acetyltransferase [Aquabacterium sp. A7-Y]|uniref:GNAT family N-acetyltransferase n=1 Tax=Aquabacterium sp. A7-Y TaxID=1349605 RepID=UPI00223CB37A|nr:GNAT family N-acetyltransferase [Aquabacterium sp. A7-Y]MCW7539746.1 GNAT family N-acetyltransferase [Aquabacterium sp. A7-Y]